MKRIFLSRRRSVTEIVVGIGVVLLVLFLNGLLAPHLTSQPTPALANTIANNLRILEDAKEEWALDHHQANGAPPTPADLAPYLKRGEFPRPVVGEIYTITPVGELNTATLTQGIARWKAGQVLTVTSF